MILLSTTNYFKSITFMMIDHEPDIIVKTVKMNI